MDPRDHKKIYDKSETTETSAFTRKSMISCCPEKQSVRRKPEPTNKSIRYHSTIL